MTTPAHWADFAKVSQIVSGNPELWPYIVLTADSGFTVFDVDFKPRRESETPAQYEARLERAEKALGRLREHFPARYESRSKSGKGFHIIVRGKFGDTGGKGKGEWADVEIYTKGHGIALTGHVSPDCENPAAYPAEKIQALRDEIKGEAPGAENWENMPDRGSHGGVSPGWARQVLAELDRLHGRPGYDAWRDMSSAVFDGVGVEAGIELLEEAWPEEKRGEYRKLAKSLQWFAPWGTFRGYGVNPDDPEELLSLMPDESGEDESDVAIQSRSTIVWGVNSFPTAVPPETVVLGNAWLRRADIAHIISTAGAGKSVAVIQAAIAWALGLPYFGIRPPHALRILLFSGEDDRVTLGQCRAGFLEHSEAITGQKLTEADLEPLDSMLRTEFSREYVGERFHTHLARLLTKSPADLVIVNPLLSYVGGEIVACASDFLRAGLMPVLQKHDCAALLAHHTGKMAKDGWDNTDDTYSGIGGGEVANVPRTILVLRPTTAEGLSVVKVCKRKTTGWKDAMGNFTTSFFVKQSSDPERPAWIPVPYAEAQGLVSGSKHSDGKGNTRKKVTPGHVVEALTAGPMKRQDLIERLKAKCRCSENPVKDAIGSAEFDELISFFTEKNPHGGREIKWFRIADDEEQRVV